MTGIHGDYKATKYEVHHSLFEGLPPEIEQQTGYDTALKATVDKFVPNRFMAMLQHIGAGGNITEVIGTNSEVQAQKLATMSKQETLNTQARTALVSAHYQRMSRIIGIADR